MHAKYRPALNRDISSSSM